MTSVTANCVSQSSHHTPPHSPIHLTPASPICSQCKITDPTRCRYPNSVKRGIPTGYIARLEQRLLDTEIALFDALTTIRALNCESLPAFARETSSAGLGGGPASQGVVNAIAKFSVEQSKPAKLKEWEELPMGTVQQREKWWRERVGAVEGLLGGGAGAELVSSRRAQGRQQRNRSVSPLRHNEGDGSVGRYGAHGRSESSTSGGADESGELRGEEQRRKRRRSPEFPQGEIIQTATSTLFVPKPIDVAHGSAVVMDRRRGAEELGAEGMNGGEAGENAEERDGLNGPPPPSASPLRLPARLNVEEVVSPGAEVRRAVLDRRRYF